MLKIIQAIVACGFVALFGWLIYDIYRKYRVATGTVWQRLITSARGSATVLWSRFCMIVASVVGFIGDAGDLLGLPEVRTFVEQWLSNPKVVATVLLAIGVVTELARKRTL
jgi:hypothetical protein